MYDVPDLPSSRSVGALNLIRVAPSTIVFPSRWGMATSAPRGSLVGLMVVVATAEEGEATRVAASVPVATTAKVRTRVRGRGRMGRPFETFVSGPLWPVWWGDARAGDLVAPSHGYGSGRPASSRRNRVEVGGGPPVPFSA